MMTKLAKIARPVMLALAVCLMLAGGAQAWEIYVECSGFSGTCFTYYDGYSYLWVSGDVTAFEFYD